MSSLAGDATLRGTEIDVCREMEDWRGLRILRPNRFRIEFRLGGMEIGHLHVGDTLHVLFPKALGRRLRELGRGIVHEIHPASGWVTHPLEASSDVEPALRLLELSYLHKALVVGRNSSNDLVVSSDEIEARLAALEPDAEIRDLVAGVSSSNRLK